MTRILLYTILSVALPSCVGIIKGIFPTAYTDKDLFKAARQVSKNEKDFYMVQKNGDTIIGNSKSTSDLLKKKYCKECSLEPTDIIEANTKKGIVRWVGDKWVAYMVKGKLNVFYTFFSTGTSSQHTYSSTGRMTVSHSDTHSFQFFVETDEHKNFGGLHYVPNMRVFLSDNEECLGKYNALVGDKTVTEDDLTLRLLDIIKLYNKQ